MNQRICIKSSDGRHNFPAPGVDCIYGCGTNQHILSYGPPKQKENPIDKLLRQVKDKPKIKFTSERQRWIQTTADMLKVPFKIVLFKTINWPMEWIRDHYLQSMKAGNSQQYWWGMIKYQKTKAKVMNSSTQLLTP